MIIPVGLIRRLLRLLITDYANEKEEDARIEQIAQLSKDLSHVGGIKHRMILAGTSASTFVGCSTAQIDQLMRTQNVERLPVVYLEFLREMGQRAGSYLNFEYTFNQLVRAKRDALNELAAERAIRPDLPELPDDAFVFLLHNQASQFYFFRTATDKADTEFYEYNEGITTDFYRRESLLRFYQQQMDAYQERANRLFLDVSRAVSLGRDSGDPSLSPLWRIKQKLIDLGVPRENIRGCSNAQIDHLIKTQGVSHLPQVYLEFLREMGHGTGPYLDGKYCYPHIVIAKQAALEKLASKHEMGHEHQPMPEDAFVFFCHNQNDTFSFFRSQEGTVDPEFYTYSDGEVEFTRHESVLKYFQDAFERCADGIKSDPRRKFVH